MVYDNISSLRSGPPILGLGVGGPGPVLGPVGPIGPGGHGPGPWGGIGLLPPPGPPFNFNIGQYTGLRIYFKKCKVFKVLSHEKLGILGKFCNFLCQICHF